jgi:hypothetical protein
VESVEIGWSRVVWATGGRQEWGSSAHGWFPGSASASRRTIEMTGGRDQKVLDEAMGLSDEERAEVALKLVSSLDGPADTDAQDAWVTEIERRAEKVLAGQSGGEDWTAAKTEIESKIRER